MSTTSRRTFLVAIAGAPVAAGLPTLTAGSAAATTGSALSAAARRHAVPPALLGAYCARGACRRSSAGPAYGPAGLVDGATRQATRDAAYGGRAPATVDTLGDAARLTGRSREELRTDAAVNLDGAAALLAQTQRSLGARTGATTDVASWYAAAALASGAATTATRTGFADGVMGSAATGTRVRVGRATEETAPVRVGSTAVDRSALARRESVRRKALARKGSPIDAPKGLDVEWVEAPYEQTGSDPGAYGNHDLGNRPVSPALNTIVIHDTEGSYASALELVQDPTYLAWNYTIRSSDGHIAQHLETKDVGWHAGNWYVNTHALGLEHEGYAADGPEWYTDALYRRSAKLVGYLARKYGIPLDRGHIIGHDQVPGIATAYIAGMHWDPGPMWDWERYFRLLGAPLEGGTYPAWRRPRVGEAVRFLPGFAGNRQVLTGSSSGYTLDGTPRSSNFVPLRSAPSTSAPLVQDLGLHPDGSPCTTDVADVGARAAAGTDYVVAAVRGDWLAVWFLGQQGWFRNPSSRPVVRVVPGARVVRSRGGEAPVYGVAYPDPSAYPDPDDVQPLSPLVYTVPAGQAYVVVDRKPPTDYYKAWTFDPDTPGDHVDITGPSPYRTVNLGHRIAYVHTADVRLSRTP